MPKRKDLRLKDYDYSQAGYYFVTICTYNRQHLLWKSDGELTTIGKEVVNTIEYIGNHPDVSIDIFVVMPNHIHLIVILQAGRRGSQPLHRVIGRLKSYTNKVYNDINKTNNSVLWQRNYYEHVIRNRVEYREIYEYIETNPLKWEEDKYYGD